MIVSGHPYFRKQRRWITSARDLAVIVLFTGKYIAYFENRSIITRIESYSLPCSSLETGRSVMKSIAKCRQGDAGGSRGCSEPYVYDELYDVNKRRNAGCSSLHPYGVLPSYICNGGFLPTVRWYP